GLEHRRPTELARGAGVADRRQSLAGLEQPGMDRAGDVVGQGLVALHRMPPPGRPRRQSDTVFFRKTDSIESDPFRLACGPSLARRAALARPAWTALPSASPPARSRPA